MLRNLIIGIGLILVFSTCTKESVVKPEMFDAKDYFPLEENNYWIYQKTLINIDAAVDVFDTTHSELKMKFIGYDDVLKHFRLERFSRADSLSDWEAFDVILVNWDELSMQWVEDNYRYVKLTDPVFDNKSWDGNIYNILDEWDYYYSNLNRTFEINELLFTTTIRVEKRNEENAIENARAFEIFKKDVGPVYEYDAEFTIQAGQIYKGNSMELILIKFGIE